MILADFMDEFMFFLVSSMILADFVDEFHPSKKNSYLCRPNPRLGGGMVDTRDLKSLGPKRPCGFDSRPRHNNPLYRHR